MDLSGFRSAMAAVAGPTSTGAKYGYLSRSLGSSSIEAQGGGKRRGSRWAMASHKTGGESATNFLAAFFDRLRKRPGGETLPDAAILARGYLVRTEDQPMGDERDRIDITIEGGDFLVGIGSQKLMLGYSLINFFDIKQQSEGGPLIAIKMQSSSFFLDVECLIQDLCQQSGAMLWQRGGQSVPILKTSMTINHYLIDRFAAHVARFTGGTV